MTNTCICGNFHYSLDHYFLVHGDYLGRTPEHRVQVPFLPNGKLYDATKVRSDQPFPMLTHKWVCKHCGNTGTTDSPATHKKNCAWITYLAWRETEPFKAGVKSVKTPTGTKTEETKPKPEEKPPKYELTEKEKAKINEYRNQLLNILIKYEFDFSDEPDKEDIIKQFKEERKDRPVGWFWEELKKVDEAENEDQEEGSPNILTQWPMWRKYAQLCQQWEDKEEGSSTIFQPSKRRRMLEWYLLGKLSFSYLEKLQGLKDKNDKPKLDPAKKYLLSDLLLLVPKKKKPKQKPQNAPLALQIERFQKEYYERLVKYIDLEAPAWYPENEVDRIGKSESYWKESSWRDFLDNARDTQSDSGIFTDLEKRINTLKTVFAMVVIERLVAKQNKHELEGFIANYDQAPEKTIYEQEKYKDKIKDILEGNIDPFANIDPDPFDTKIKYYDDLFNFMDRYSTTELTFSSLTAKQWDQLSEDSELKKGVFELRNFDNLKKLKIKVNRPYLNAPIIKKIDLSATADDLEELDLSQCEELENLILGKKPELKKMDVRWTSLKKLNLSKTKITPQNYDTLAFPIRQKTAGIEPPARTEGETDQQYAEKLYRTGEIIWPFENFTGDPALITLPRANITFNIPWIRYGRDWSNISNEFRTNPEYIQGWYDKKFDYETAKSWMDIFPIDDKEKIKYFAYCAWLRDIKKKNAEWVLNHGNSEELQTEYNKWVEENKN